MNGIVKSNDMTTTSSPILQPFTNVQLELLKVFAHQISESDFLDLRTVLVQFFAQRATAAADAAWDKNNQTDADVERLLNTKLLTPYQR
jgi:hypothetical protein